MGGGRGVRVGGTVPDDIEARKRAHIDLCLDAEVSSSVNWWDDVRFVHEPLPEIDRPDIDTSTTLLGCTLRAPLLISGMTGGCDSGASINARLAEAAGIVGVAMGVGSQRPALEKPEWEWSYEVVKDKGVPLMFGNVGVPQLLPQGGRPAMSVETIGRAMEMVGADACCLHLNFLQEAVQPEGDVYAKGALSLIAEVASKYPVVAKETGAGIHPSAISRLVEAGVSAVDVGGLSGTSWSAVEHHRAVAGGFTQKAALGELYWDWGLPTPACVACAPADVPIIATGGLRHGLDLLRAIVLGAQAGGFARRLLRAADTSVDAVVQELEGIIDEFATGMFLLGARTLADLTDVEAMVTGDLASWVDHLRRE